MKSNILTLFLLSLMLSSSFEKGLSFLSEEGLMSELVSFANGELKGMDVSSYQGKINWQRVKEAGIKFAIFRSTVRGGEMDSQFENNYAGAKKVGIPFSIYHFSYATSAAQSKRDAQNLINKLKGRKMPIYLDVEWETQMSMGKRAVTDIGIAFVKTCKEAGYECNIYSNTDWYLHHFYPQEFIDLGCKFWLAAYGRDTGVPDMRYKPNKGEYIWQYTSKGRVDGVDGNVDLDIMYGTPSVNPEDPKPVEPITPEPIEPGKASVEKMVKITASSGVNRRSSPSSANGNNIVGGYMAGAIAQVKGITENGEWYIDKDGYYFTANPEWVSDLRGSVNCSALNVRRQPTTSSDIITTISEGTKMMVLKKESSWYYIKLGSGTTGYVYGSYITTF